MIVKTKYVDIGSFADDNTSYMSANNITNLVEDLKDSPSSIFNWISNNQMQENATKCYILLRKKRVSYCKSIFMNFNQKKKLMNVFFKTQFNYCPVAWVLHSRKLNNKINRLGASHILIFVRIASQ